MAELGQTSEPKALVPGEVSAVVATMHAFRDYAENLEEAGQGLLRITTEAGWRGEAADAFNNLYQGQPSRWLTASGCFESAADALDRYADTLSWAQAEASAAITEYAEGDAATDRAVDRYNERVRQHNEAVNRGVTPAPLEPFTDPGESARQAARDQLARAREQLLAAGDDAERTVASARDLAPQEPTILDRIGGGIADAAGAVGGFLYDVGAEAVNALASFGNAMVNNPAETAAMLGGLLTMGFGATMTGGGAGLSATGGGAVAGAPAAAWGVGLVAAGGATAAAGAGMLGQHAVGKDRVRVAEARAHNTARSPGSAGKRGTPTDRAKEHLTDRDLDAAQRELRGEVVKRKPDGTPWNHVQEVRETQNKLANRIEVLKRQLGDTRLSGAQKEAVQSELSEASRLLDHSKQFVPRK